MISAESKISEVEKIKLNNEYSNYFRYLNNGNGVPMVTLNHKEHLIHELYCGQAKIAWDFAKHYSRHQKTGVIKHNPLQ